jgi:hypothetical protein
MPKFEQDSIDSCINFGPVTMNQADYPWIAGDSPIQTFLVTLKTGTKFRFGSIIGLNKTIEKIAAAVPSAESASTQTALFMGLPALLSGKPASGISRVENSKLPNSTLFIASRNLVSAAGLIFSVQAESDETRYPLVLRAGISTAKQRTRLLSVMGIHQPGGKRRQS